MTPDESDDPTPEELESSFITFGEKVLGLHLYPWQCESVEPFDEAGEKLVQVSLATPNGSGKSAVVIPTLALGWLALFPKGRVVITTADGKQLDGQVMPALEAHRGKFDRWTFIEREIRTPTGGRLVAFTTDQAGRAEGWHKLDDTEGPLLIIADEAKTIPEDIFSAIDRCTYNGLLLTSSPGSMQGRFYRSQMLAELGFIRIKIGLLDCPHIGQDKIDRIIAEHGATSPFTRSTLHGEFMEAEGELRFNRAGLDRLAEMVETVRKMSSHDPERPQVGWVEEGTGLLPKLVWTRDENGPLWICEHPVVGCQYIGFCDPATGAQAEGSKTRDGAAAGVMRLGYTDEKGVEHPDEPVAFLHGPNYGPVHWDNDIVVEALDVLLRYYGDPPANVESNNAGVEVIRMLQMGGRTVCRRKRRDHKNPGKLTEIVGFQTNESSKREWVGALAVAIREQTLDCCYPPAVEQLQTFVVDEHGRGAAQSGKHDDFVTGIGLALVAKHWAKRYEGERQLANSPANWRGEEVRIGGAWT